MDFRCGFGRPIDMNLVDIRHGFGILSCHCFGVNGKHAVYRIS